MSFTSLNFLLFLIIVVIVYYCMPRKYRWTFLLAASYYFYFNWQPIYAVLLIATTVITYICTYLLGKEDKTVTYRKTVCSLGCIFPLCSLGLFKYYNFITTGITSALSIVGLHLEMPELDFLMPVGISFYTFTAVGYMIDVYRRDYRPEKNFFVLSLFISFFAQIASGPIPRGAHLIPQLRKPEELSYENIIGGIRIMAWGFFMKLCVANRLGIYVDAVYGNISHHNGVTLLFASILYTIQIYCDFAGYSLIAIGTARMLGLRLMDNFRRPYFATSIKDFWSRWHISLSTWFRDYVYIPLGGNRVSKKRNIFNLVTTFVISGLWHGAAWNFLLWGGLHGAGQSVEKLSGNSNNRSRRITNFFLSFGKILLVFFIVNFLWVFFRLQSMNEITTFYSKLFTDYGSPFTNQALVTGILAVLILFAKDLVDEYWPTVRFMNSKNILISNMATGWLISIILLLGVFDSSSFIYFQF